MEESHIPELEVLTKNLLTGIEHPFDSNGILKMLEDYFDTMDTCIAIVRDDYQCIFMNKYAIERMEGFTKYKKDAFVGKPCLGIQASCPLKDKCNSDIVWEDTNTPQIRLYKNVTSAISDNIYDVIISPLKFNGTKAIIEMWVECEHD